MDDNNYPKFTLNEEEYYDITIERNAFISPKIVLPTNNSFTERPVKNGSLTFNRIAIFAVYTTCR